MSNKKTDKPIHNVNEPHLDRRTFAKRIIQAALASKFAASAQASAFSDMNTSTPTLSGKELVKGLANEYEYIVVGSGAGGGPLAANLAIRGYRVLVLEAGDADLPSDVHDIPAWHPLASEDPKLTWEFFVKHYEDETQQRKDSKYVEGKGIFYPRGSTIGGSTAVHALITVYPHHSDFDRISAITGDDSWRSENMRQYFQRLENCDYLPAPPFSDNPGEHGFNGWLPTRLPDLTQLLEEPKLLKVVKAALLHYGLGDILEELLRGEFTLDVNDIDVAGGKEGPFISAMSANRFSRRQSVREYLLETQKKYPDRLHVLTNALATQILFEGSSSVGVKVDYGKNLYKADPLHNENTQGIPLEFKASREVIVSAGAFNSPQLLKLSGVGPAAEIQSHGIEPLVDLPGVGENLQDRYEIGVVSQFKENIELTENCTFGEDNDPCLTRYKRVWWSRGAYGSKGATLSIIKRSRPELEDPDLFMFGLPAEFSGYYPGYSLDVAGNADRFTWVILKGHTENRAGTVKLNSADPRDTPDINFHYFREGEENDLQAVVNGVKFSRDIMEVPPAKNLIHQELVPGEQYQSDAEVAEFVRNEAWGHHASCTNKMGASSDPMAVVDSKFRVYGTENLRVVDASIFPFIPGFFLAVPIYMISEKACDDIVATALDKDKKKEAQHVG